MKWYNKGLILKQFFNSPSKLKFSTFLVIIYILQIFFFKQYILFFDNLSNDEYIEYNPAS